jgi:hypothetical protein
LEATQVALGHAAANVTELYAERDLAFGIYSDGASGIVSADSLFGRLAVSARIPSPLDRMPTPWAKLELEDQFQEAIRMKNKPLASSTKVVDGVPSRVVQDLTVPETWKTIGESSPVPVKQDLVGTFSPISPPASKSS